MRNDRRVNIRRLIPLFILLLPLAAQDAWQKATEIPGVDLSGLPQSIRPAALSILRAEACPCGGSMKIAECRVNDPACSASRRLALFVIREMSSGISAAAV